MNVCKTQMTVLHASMTHVRKLRTSANISTHTEHALVNAVHQLVMSSCSPVRYQFVINALDKENNKMFAIFFVIVQPKLHFPKESQ